MKNRNDYVDIIRQSSRSMEPIPTKESSTLKAMQNVEAILLDVYGTLFISASGEIGVGDDDLHSAAIIEALRGVGVNLRDSATEGISCLRQTIAEFHQQSRQRGIDFPEVDIIEVWRTTLHRLRDAGKVSGCLDDVDFAELSLRYELTANPVWPMPCAADCLTELSNRGILLGLISNAQWFTPLLFPALLGGELDALGIGSDLHFWSWRAGRAKPSEHLFRLAADALLARGIKAQHVLHVGNDLLNDIAPAAAVGFRTGLFAGDQRSLRRRSGDPRVESVTPEIVVTQLRDLLACVRPNRES